MRLFGLDMYKTVQEKMVITIEWAKNPVYADDTGNVIDLTIKFVEFNDPILFAATSYDSEEYGKQIYANAVAGQYGPVAPYVPPAPVSSVSISPSVADKTN